MKCNPFAGVFGWFDLLLKVHPHLTCSFAVHLWCFLVFQLRREMGFDPVVLGRFDLAALIGAATPPGQTDLKFLFVCIVRVTM